jgi:hypothetical protein
MFCFFKLEGRGHWYMNFEQEQNCHVLLQFSVMDFTRELFVKVRLLFWQAHLNTCKHDAVPCTNKCGAQIPRVLMEDHLKYTCPQRRARCEFCGKDFTGHTLEVSEHRY